MPLSSSRAAHAVVPRSVSYLPPFPAARRKRHPHCAEAARPENRIAQNGELPLHYALSNGALLTVVTLLLDSKFIAATSLNKVHHCAHTAHVLSLGPLQRRVFRHV